jgi:hypothetical protein
VDDERHREQQGAPEKRRIEEGCHQRLWSRRARFAR